MSRQADTAPVGFLNDFKRASQRICNEREGRVAIGKQVLKFGVPFLDEALGGIFSNDLILLGSKTGTGKTQLATSIAQANIKSGKRVHYFALEAEDCEIERRIKYQWIADRFYKLAHNERPSIHLCYLDWYLGRYDSELNTIEKEVESQYGSLDNLFTFYRKTGFKAEDFLRLALPIKGETDLIIIDHLHYFDHDDPNENRAIKDIVMKIRDCALLSGKPIILIAHLRKSDRKAKQLIPDIDDFHGSSDIGKIATKAITLAPCRDAENMSPSLRATYFQTLKCRTDGSRQHRTGLLAFNVKTNTYERQYYLGTLSFDGTSVDYLDQASMPHWAVNAMVKRM